MIHNLEISICDNLPTQFTYPYNYTPHPLVVRAAEEVEQYLLQNSSLFANEEGGKMFGVAIVEDCEGKIGFIVAFSALLSGESNHSYFVPPIFDTANSSSYFKQEEKTITAINSEIIELQECEEYKKIVFQREQFSIDSKQKLEEQKSILAQQKAARKELRSSSALSQTQLEELNRESQFQKGELKRLEQQISVQLEKFDSEIVNYTSRIEQLKKERKERSVLLQKWLFDNYIVHNFKGESSSLSSIFSSTTSKIPPAGAGECAAPKLLQYAALNSLKPLAMGEFWWGESPKGVIRVHKKFYPSCSGKCEPILNFMMQGLQVEQNPLLKNRESFATLETLFEDRDLLVVNKPSGMLSTKGKIDLESVESFLERSGCGFAPYVVHRLDMATSGALIVAKNRDTYQQLQRQFESREVKKCYVAVLDGVLDGIAAEGVISLPLSGDFLNRPFQKVDFNSGKESVTYYKLGDICEIGGKKCRKVIFYPQTGRTHQLRVHSAHPLGLNCPILGDNLYGAPQSRLYLHAFAIAFTSSSTDKTVSVEAPLPF